MARQGWLGTLRGVAMWGAVCAVLALFAAAWHVPARVTARLAHPTELKRALPQVEGLACAASDSIAPTWLARLRPPSEVARERAQELGEPSRAAFGPDSGLLDRAGGLAGPGRCSASLPQWLAAGGTRPVCTGGAAARAPPHV